MAPHRDDAAFSVTATLTRLIAAGAAVRIVSCFTVSEWAPHVCSPSGRERVTAVREDEDKRFVARLGDRAELVSLPLLDGPLRPDWRDYKTWPEVDSEPLPAALCSELEETFARLDVTTDFWLLPLALEHRDHLIARAAALAAIKRKPLVFYEDVPYIFWFDEPDVLSRVQEVESLIKRQLLPRVLHAANDLDAWPRAASIYQSQFSEQQIASMYRLLQARGGERVWVTPDFMEWID